MVSYRILRGVNKTHYRGNIFYPSNLNINIKNLKGVFITLLLITSNNASFDRVGAINTMFNEDNRGQVGIGTLIVFIAMVLVAAIAAGVLINTAGLLQAQAQQTGEETTAEVSDVIQIQEVVGSDDGSPGFGTTATENGRINLLNVSVRLASGSDPINMSQTSYTISSPRGSATVINGNENSNDNIQHTGIQSLNGSNDDESVLKEQEDLLLVQINLEGQDGIESLNESQRVKLVAQAPAGGQSFAELKTPRNIENGDTYIL
jgi:flagellin FlaB